MTDDHARGIAISRNLRTSQSLGKHAIYWPGTVAATSRAQQCAVCAYRVREIRSRCHLRPLHRLVIQQRFDDAELRILSIAICDFPNRMNGDTGAFPYDIP